MTILHNHYIPKDGTLITTTVRTSNPTKFNLILIWILKYIEAIKMSSVIYNIKYVIGLTNIKEI
jgi:hypothetical protein